MTQDWHDLLLCLVLDEPVGSTSQSTVAHTNTDKDEMEEVVDEEENVEDVVRERLSKQSACLGMWKKLFQ